MLCFAPVVTRPPKSAKPSEKYLAKLRRERGIQAPHLNGGSMGCASSKASEPTAADAIALSPKPADSPKPGTAAAVQPAVQAAPSDAVSLQPAGSGLKVDAAGSPRLASGASITAEPPATLPASSSSDIGSPKAAPAPAPAVAKAPSAGVAPAPATESESVRELGPQTLYDRSLAPELVAAWEAEQKFTEEQNAAMSELRSRMLPKFNAEHVRLFDNKPSLYRFCQARQFDVDKAELMFTNHLAWRTDNDVSPLVATELGEVPKICASFTYPQIPAVKQAYQFIHHKTSKAGLPVYIDRVGALNYKELKAAMGDDGLPKYLKFMVCYGEASMAFRFPAASVAAGRYIGKGIYIVDLTGFKITMFTSEVRAFLKEFTAIFGDNYPETVEKMFIVNSPWIFKQVWNFVSPMMDERTRNKTKILGGPKEFIPAITEVVDLESIPELLGGKDTSCDFVHEQGPWAAQLPPMFKA